jgi:hypothetical protein
LGILSKPALIKAATGLPPLSLIILTIIRPFSIRPIILPPLPSHPTRVVWFEVTMAACRRDGIGRSPYLVSDLLADEVVLHGEHGGCRAGGDAYLRVDVLDVMACGLR